MAVHILNEDGRVDDVIQFTHYGRVGDGIDHLLTPQWRVKNIVPAKGVMLVVGDTSVGKSALSISVGAHIAAALPDFAGNPIRDRREAPYVLHVDPEGSAASSHRRLLAHQMGNNWPDIRQDHVQARGAYRHFGAERLSKLKLVDNSLCMALLKNVWTDWGDGRHKQTPSLIIFDGLSMLYGAEENDNSAAADIMRAIKRIGEELDCPVWINHHTPKAARFGGQKASARGASAFEDNADLIADIKREDEDSRERTFTIRKGREVGNIADALTFEVSGFCIGQDEYGDDVTAPAAHGYGSADRRQSNMTAAEKGLLKVHEVLYAEFGGLSLEEIAERMSLPASTVRGYLDLGIKRNEITRTKDGRAYVYSSNAE